MAWACNGPWIGAQEVCALRVNGQTSVWHIVEDDNDHLINILFKVLLYEKISITVSRCVHGITNVGR